MTNAAKTSRHPRNTAGLAKAVAEGWAKVEEVIALSDDGKLFDLVVAYSPVVGQVELSTITRISAGSGAARRYTA
jgi:hypothetical protein